MNHRNEGRVRDDGHPDDRALIEAAAEEPTLPPLFAASVRANVERRLAPTGTPRRRARWTLGIAGVLVATGALAYPVVRSLDPPAPVPPPAPPARVAQPMVEPQAPPPTPPPVKPPALAPSPPQKQAAPPPAPGVKKPSSAATEAGPAVGAEAERATSDHEGHWLPVPAAKWAPNPPQLLDLNHPGRREGTLTATPNPAPGVLLRLAGTVQGTQVELEVKPPLIVGHIGQHPVSIVTHGENARGTIGGWQVSFRTTPTRTGRLLRGEMPGHEARVDLDLHTLSWYPGCERDLTGSGEGPRTFKGSCALEPQARLTLPKAFLDLPAVPKLVLLAILLTDRDPVFRDQPPFLYGPRAQ